MKTNRYQRQMILPEINIDGQDRLLNAKIFVVGIGGLGSALLPWLVGAGVGHLILMDHDRVEENNLHRQTLYTMDDIGRFKAEAAIQRLTSVNPEIMIQSIIERLTPDNAANIVQNADIVIDAADNMAVTYTLSDCCTLYKKPFISASVTQWSGYVGAFCLNGPSYRAVFPEIPEDIQNCSVSGVIGTAVATIGSLQAQMTLSYLLKVNPSPMHRLIHYNAKKMHFSEFSFVSAKEPNKITPFIGISDISSQDLVIDLRSTKESMHGITQNALRSSVMDIPKLSIPKNRRIVLCCRSGIRAAKAASLLKKQGISDIALIAAG